MVGISPLMRQKVRARVENMMTASITITRGGSNAFDPATGELAGGAGGTVIYQGKARIRVVSGSAVVLGDGYVDAVSTMVSIPITAPMPHRDDLITVVDDNLADTDLATRTLRVVEVEGGSLFGDARRMTCSASAPSKYWGS